VAGDFETNNVGSSRRPSRRRRPSSLEDVGILALSVAAGLFLVSVVAFAVDYFDTTVKTPDDVERIPGLPGSDVPLFAEA